MKKKKNCENKKGLSRNRLRPKSFKKTTFATWWRFAKKSTSRYESEKNWRMHLFRFGEKWHFPKKCYQLFDKLKCSATNLKIKGQYFYSRRKFSRLLSSPPRVQFQRPKRLCRAIAIHISIIREQAN